MRIDLTIRGRDGTDHDVSVEAPEGTTFGAASIQLADAAAGERPSWVGRQRLRPDSIIGTGVLRDGAILTDEPGTDDAGGAPGARLEIVGGPRAGHGVTVTGPRVSVGRDPSNDLVLPDPQVSRHHAVLTVSGVRMTVRDLGSTHGTWIDDTPVTGEMAVRPASVVRLGDTFLAITTAPGAVASLRDGAAGTVVVNRPPRPHRQPSDATISLPAPPTRHRSPRVQWTATLLPALGGAVLAWLMHSVQFLAFAALTPLALLAGTFGDRLHWRRSRRRALAGHARAAARIHAEIAAALVAETALRRDIDPDPSAVRHIACTPTTRLWERRRGDDDLLRVRIGLASLPSALRIDRGGTLVATTLKAVPTTVDLQRGPIGIAAPAPVRDTLASWILAQLAVLTSPADVEIAFLLSDDAAWRWARWLPHVRGKHASTAAEREALAAELIDLVRSRREGHSTSRTWAGPWLVVVLDKVGSLGAVLRLATALADGAGLGLTALCLDDRAHKLPAGCVHVVCATGEVGSTVRVGAATVVADRVDIGWAERIARALAPLCDAQADGAAGLPAQCRLAELPGFQLPGFELPGHDTAGSEHEPACLPVAVRTSAAHVLAGWQRSDGSASTVLGVGPDGPLWVDLVGDGPHLLVAGTTGSGKSELLQTLIAGLAIRHPPTELTFLLVDYKGGAAFAQCGELPHTAGLVTDLDDHLAGRVLASLDCEIRRREVLLAAAHTHDLAAYRRGGAALARLILVIDEFAALAEELAGFVPALVAIAQRGRSLGLHLVLATQRPAGVVSPGIRANTTLRIALRVTDAAESVDVLDGPQAATIHRRNPGRGYLRTGAATMIFQAARVAVAAPATPTQRIRVTPLDGWRRTSAQPESGGDTDLQRYVRCMRFAFDGEPQVRRPWLPALPTRIALTELSAAVAPAELVPIGLLDLPNKQRQEPLAIDLRAGGSVLIVGGARSGRSTALLSLALGAARRCSPVDLHIHAVHGAGSALASLRSLAHVGTLATIPDGVELAARFVRRMRDELARRREARTRQPALLLLVDGWEQLLVASEEYDGGHTVERLIALLGEAPAAGATIVVTGGRAALAPRLAAQIPTRLLLQLNDPSDYALAGVDTRSVPTTATRGRGVRVVDGAEFQLAQAGATSAEEARLAGECVEHWHGVVGRPLRLRALPSRVAVVELGTRPGRIVLGVGGDEARPISIDLRAGAGRLLVAGPARSGRSTLLCSVLSQIRDDPTAGLLVAAPRPSRLAAVAREAGVRVLGPGDPAPELAEQGLLLVDDAELFADTDMGAALSEWVGSDAKGRYALVAARNDTVAVAFRGLPFVLRQSRCGVLLQPGPVDGELLGVNLPRGRARALPGRGVLIPDPAWELGDAPLAVQIAMA